MKIGKILSGVVIAVAITAFFSFFIVKEVNQAIILVESKKIISKPGLNFKIPFIQNVVFLDKEF